MRGGACSTDGSDLEIRTKLLSKNLNGRGPLGRYRLRCEDNNKRDLKEIGRGRVDWIRLDQDRDR